MIKIQKLTGMEGFGDGDAKNPFVRIPILGVGLVGISLRCLGQETSGGATLIASARVKKYTVEIDGSQETWNYSTLRRKVDDLDNANDDTMAVDCIWVPLAQPGPNNLWTIWGTNNLKTAFLRLELNALSTIGSGGTFTGIDVYLHYVDYDGPLGDHLIERVIEPAAPITANDYNTLENIPLPDIFQISRILLDDSHITKVRVRLGDRILWEVDKTSVLFSMQRNPLFKGDSATNGFPLFFDGTGLQADYLTLLNSQGVKENLKIEYYWNGNAGTLAAFKMYLQGRKRGVVVPVAEAKA